MSFLLSGANVYLKDGFTKCDVVVKGNSFFNISPTSLPSLFDFSFNLNNCLLLPGLIDVHTHLREPGFLYKETIETGTMAAARGGYTSVCSMPNLKPCPDSEKNICAQLEVIEKTANVHVYPYGTITKGQAGKELSDMEALSKYTDWFSDDGRGVQTSELMEEAMIKAKSLGKMIVAHCEDNSLLNGGYIHDGEYAKAHGHKGICSESEWGPIKRDIELVKKTGCRYHVCHISAKESVELIRQAKAEGLPVTCETAPHYLTLCDSDLQEDGRFKMNPPIRSAEDRAALIEGIKDGTIDMIATDHAPHSKEEKSKGLEGSLMGIVGLETAFAVLYTSLVKPGIITIEKLVELMHDNPKRIFGIGSDVEIGEVADFTVFDINTPYKIDENEFATKGRSTPFSGMEVYGKCVLTVSDGRIIWQDSSLKK